MSPYPRAQRRWSRKKNKGKKRISSSGNWKGQMLPVWLVVASSCHGYCKFTIRLRPSICKFTIASPREELAVVLRSGLRESFASRKARVKGWPPWPWDCLELTAKLAFTRLQLSLAWQCPCLQQLVIGAIKKYIKLSY